MALSRETLLDALRAFAADCEGSPSRTEMNDEGPYSSAPYYRVFDSWNDALRAAGLETNHENEISDERLLDELRRVDGELDRVVQFEDMAEYGEFSPTTYHRRWGSWPEAKEAAGLRAETQTSRRIEREELIRVMRDLAAEVGGPPTQEQMNECGEFTQRPYYREFDSWEDALDAAGLERIVDRGTPDEELREALLELSDQVDGSPTFDEMNARGRYSIYPYLRRWGTWNNALRAAGLDVNKERGGEGGVLDYGPNWFDQRRTALERDDWACCECGMANDEHVDEYGQGLDVHHREKFRSFESAAEANRLGNLVSLCRSCHADVEWG